MKQKAYLVPTFHHDISYLKPESDYTPRCFRILDEALYILENNPEYRFFMEQAWLLEEYWDARPEKRGLMRALAAEGRFSIEPGLYAVPDMNLPDGESLFMHAYIGRKISKETLGSAPRVCMIADCWGHHAQIPQILSSCGYDYYAFSRCMRKDADRQNFIWKGVDGSTIKAHWMSTHYDGIQFPTDAEKENAAELAWAEAGAEGINALMDKNRVKCGDDPQYLPVGGDMNFPSRRAPGLVKKLNERNDLPELVFALPGTALDAVPWEKEPVFDGEFESSMQGTFTTNIIIKQADRKYAGELFAAEAMAAVLNADADLEDAWKLHLKNQFHDIACGTICNRALKDAEADFRALGHMINRERRRMTGGAGEKAYFNPLPFRRSVLLDEGVLTLEPLAFTPASKAVRPEKAEYLLPLKFENEYYSAETDKNGYVVSLVEKKSGRQLVKNGSRVPFGCLVMQMDYGDSWWEFAQPMQTRVSQAYVLNRPDPLVNDSVRTFTADIDNVEIIRADSEAVTIRQTGNISFWVTEVRFTTDITFSKHDRMIRYNTRFTNNAKDIRIRAAFETEGLTEAYRQIPYATVPFGDGIQACQRFACLTDGTGSLAVINRGTPAYSTDGDMLLLSLFRAAAMEYKCDSSDSYGVGRDYSFDYAVAGASSGDENALWDAALDFNIPYVPAVMPEKQKKIRTEGAYLSALRKTENGLFVRIYNPFGKPSCASVYAEGAEKAYLTDGLMNETEECGCVQSKAVIVLKPYEVRGVMLK